MHAEVHVAYGLDDDGTGDPAPGPTTQPSSDSTDPRAGAGRAFPQRGEGRPSHKSLAVTYAATIVATRRTNTLAPNHPWLRNPRPLCEHLRPHDMIASCGEPGLPAAFAPASIVLSSNRRAPAIRLTEHPADDRQTIAERERPRGGAVADVKNAHIVQPGARPACRGSPAPADAGPGGIDATAETGQVCSHDELCGDDRETSRGLWPSCAVGGTEAAPDAGSSVCRLRRRDSR